MIAERESLHLLLVEDDEDDYLLTRAVLAELPETRCTLEWVTTYEAALERWTWPHDWGSSALSVKSRRCCASAEPYTAGTRPNIVTSRVLTP